MKKQLFGIILALIPATPLIATLAEPAQSCSIRAGDYNLPACPSNKTRKVQFKVVNANNFTLVYYIANKRYELPAYTTHSHTRNTSSSSQAITFDRIAGNGKMDKTYVWVDYSRRDKVIVKYKNNYFTSRTVQF